MVRESERGAGFCQSGRLAGSRKALFQVVWTDRVSSSTEAQTGVECLVPEVNIWGLQLPEADDEIANREVLLAHTVQRRLLPQQLPPLRTLSYSGHCTQAGTVGGDYYREHLFQYSRRRTDCPMINDHVQAKRIARWTSYSAFAECGRVLIVLALHYLTPEGKQGWRMALLALLNASLFFAISIGIRKMSRMAAVAGLILYLCEMVWRWEVLGRHGFGVVQSLWSLTRSHTGLML